MNDVRDVPYCETCGYGSGGHADWCESYQELEWKNKKLRAALEAVEFVDTWVIHHTTFCPWCKRNDHDGHASDCQRQKALGL